MQGLWSEANKRPKGNVNTAHDYWQGFAITVKKTPFLELFAFTNTDHVISSREFCRSIIYAHMWREQDEISTKLLPSRVSWSGETKPSSIRGLFGTNTILWITGRAFEISWNRCLISAMKIRAARNCFATRAMPAKNLHQIKKRTGEACKFKAQIHWFYSLNMQMRGVLVGAFIIIALAPWRRELADLRNITGKSFSLISITFRTQLHNAMKKKKLFASFKLNFSTMLHFVSSVTNKFNFSTMLNFVSSVTNNLHFFYFTFFPRRNYLSTLKPKSGNGEEMNVKV